MRASWALRLAAGSAAGHDGDYREQTFEQFRACAGMILRQHTTPAQRGEPWAEWRPKSYYGRFTAWSEATPPRRAATPNCWRGTPRPTMKRRLPSWSAATGRWSGTRAAARCAITTT